MLRIASSSVQVGEVIVSLEFRDVVPRYLNLLISVTELFPQVCHSSLKAVSLTNR